MNYELTIYSDGGARGNPGPSACAFVVEREGKILFKQSKYLGNSTNNVAEYSGVILALKWLLGESSIKYQVSSIQVFLDSELVAKQLNGIFKIKNEKLRNLFYTIKSLEKNIGVNISYKNISREKNRLADFLVNRELDKFS